MNEDEMLGIAETEPNGEEVGAEEAVVQDGAGEMGTEEALALCVRYEKARQPWASDEEARQMAMTRLGSEGAEEYVAEVFEWHKAGEPPIEEGAEAEEEVESTK